MAMTGLTATGLQLVPADVSLSGVKANLIGAGVSLPGGVSLPAASSPFTPLPGSAVDMNFLTSQYYPAPLASLMDGTLTSAIGALLTALQSPACSILLSLKANPTIPTNWVSGTGGSQTFLIRGVTDTTVTTKDNFATPTTLTATAGSGAFSTTACKICVMYDSTTGRSLVMNNGTVATDAQFPSLLLTGAAFANVAAAFNRLTVYTSRLSDVAGKALTV